MNRGLIQRHLAERLLKKYGVPMTPPSRVNQAVPKVDVLQSELDL